MINAEWHADNPMPRRATLDQRVAWHAEHAERCGCRTMPAAIAREISRRRRRPAGKRRRPPP